MKYILFTLTMPNIGSWNGRWSGSGSLHARVRRFPSKSDDVKRIVDTGYYHYSFGDGWSAAICTREITRKEKISIEKESSGFCGYDWMIDSIILHNKIIPRTIKTMPVESMRVKEKE